MQLVTIVGINFGNPSRELSPSQTRISPSFLKLYGMHGVTLYTILQDILKWLEMNNIRPIFIIDAIRTEQKSLTQINRRNDHFDRIGIDAKTDLRLTCQEITHEKKFRVSHSRLSTPDDFYLNEEYRFKVNNTSVWGPTVVSILRELNCEVYIPITDADSGTYKLAMDRAIQIPKNKNVIILSNDSDFYLFDYPQNIHYCGMKDFWYKMAVQEPDGQKFKIHSGRTQPFTDILCFNQKYFADYLQLKTHQLYYVALFTGNCFITGDNSLKSNDNFEDFDDIWEFLVENNRFVLNHRIKQACQEKPNFQKMYEQTVSFYGGVGIGEIFEIFEKKSQKKVTK